MLLKLHLINELILFAFVTCHIISHIFVLYSIELMDDAHVYLLGSWRYPSVNILLVIAVITHIFLALKLIFIRRTYKLANWQWL